MVAFNKEKETLATRLVVCYTAWAMATGLLGWTLTNYYTLLGSWPCTAGVWSQAAYFCWVQRTPGSTRRHYRTLGSSALVMYCLWGLGSRICHFLPEETTTLAKQAIWELPVAYELQVWWWLLYISHALLGSNKRVGQTVSWIGALGRSIAAILLTLLLACCFLESSWHPLFLGNSAGLLLGTILWSTLGSGIEQWLQVSQQEIASAWRLLPQRCEGVIWCFASCCLLSNLLAIKHINLMGAKVTAGLIPYVFTFTCTDILTECYGPRMGEHVVWAGLGVILLLLLPAMGLPLFPVATTSPASVTMFQQSFHFVSAVLGAALVAYMVAQWTDLYLFSWFKKRTAGKFLWLRNNVATVLSQAIDTVIFASVTWLFWLVGSGESPAFSWQTWVAIAWHEYGWKVVLALLDTPLVYGVIYLIRNQQDVRYQTN